MEVDKQEEERGPSDAIHASVLHDWWNLAKSGYGREGHVKVPLPSTWYCRSVKVGLHRTWGVDEIHTRFPKTAWEIMKIHGFR